MNAVVQAVQGLGSGRLIALTLVGITLMGVMLFITMRLSSPVMTSLYSNLNAEDSGTIITELGAMGVEFQTAQGGSEVKVGSADVLRVRMALAQKGLPSQGSIVGYEIFDREQALGTSNFVLNINQLRALEGELGRTIAALSAVKGARVHLVMPKRNLFERSRVNSTASVVLTLQSGNGLSKSEAEAIKQLVSTAVPALKSDRITIVDNKGRVLARGEAESDQEAISAAKTEDFKQSYEKRMKRTIELLLEEAVGAGNIRAEVSADLAFDRITTSIEEFDPESQVARSVQTNEELVESAGGGAGAVSVGNNLPGGGADNAGGGDSERIERVEEVKNFEISKTITNRITEVGAVQKLSIAVLVDGSYNITKDEETEEITKTYVPRSDEEVAQLRALVETAIGFDQARGDKIEIINMQFESGIDELIEEDDPLAWVKNDLNSIIKTLVVGVVAILAILLVIRPMVTRAFETQPLDMLDGGYEPESFNDMQVLSNPDALGGGMGEDGELNLDMIQNSMDASPTKRVNELIESNPEETVAVLRTWMQGK